MDDANTPVPADEKSIFEEAIGRSGSERSDFLNVACGNDPAMLARIEHLLRLHEEPSFMATPTEQTISPEVEFELARLKPEEAGEFIGPYKLLQQIGEGGFGSVWMAEQERPVRRRVALKIIKLGMDTKEVVARFEQERQALAMMDHPNIAKVFDAGATPFGRLYFVMELVKGVRITEYCDGANLSTGERLKLFIHVCHAVQHAHQKGIIHRDLKPSNVLVTLHDGVPVPKVIDFGVAKATQQQRLTDLTLFTQFQQMIGTPLYMAPEQAELSGLDIDTRSDIYSLGVLLYELLTGRTPFDAERLMKAGFDEMRRVIREEEPEKPSTAISTMAADLRTDVAKHRSVEGSKLVSSVRGDLDWIVMKALEKDRRRRYESATGFARDIERHLCNEPVLARPASAGYRFGRFVRRNKGVVAATSAVMLALLIGLGTSTWMFFQERIARTEADTAGKEREIEQQRAEVASGFLKDMLSGVSPSVAMGRDTKLLREILDKTSERLGDLKEQPLVEADLRTVLGNVYGALAENTKALAMHSEALALREKHLGSENASVATSIIEIGSILSAQEKFEDSEAKIRQGLAMLRKAVGPESPDIAATMTNLAFCLRAQGKLAEAETLAREALIMNRKLHGDVHLSVAHSLQALRQARGWQAKYEEDPAAANLNLREILKKTVGTDHPEYANELVGLAGSRLRRGKLEESEDLITEALGILKRMYEDGQPLVREAYFVLASLRAAQMRHDEAETHFNKFLAIERKTSGEDSLEVARWRHKIGHEFSKYNALSQAEAWHRDALRMFQTLPGIDEQELLGAQVCLSSILTEKAWTQRGKDGPASGTSPQEAAREAERIARSVLSIRLSDPDAKALRLDHARSRLGGALVALAVTDSAMTEEEKLSKFLESEKLLLSSVDRIQSDSEVNNLIARRDSITRLIRLYRAWPKLDAAALWEQKLKDYDLATAKIAHKHIGAIQP